jgi:hypothetical protein
MSGLHKGQGPVDHSLVIPELTLAQENVSRQELRKAWPLRWSPLKSFGVVGFSPCDGSRRVGAVRAVIVSASRAGDGS